MIFSIVEMVSEQERIQKIIVRGSSIEISTEISNIIKETLNRGFPEELLLKSIIDAFEDRHKEQ